MHPEDPALPRPSVGRPICCEHLGGSAHSRVLKRAPPKMRQLLESFHAREIDVNCLRYYRREELSGLKRLAVRALLEYPWVREGQSAKVWLQSYGSLSKCL